MIVFNPGGRVSVCGEAARIVDGIFVIMNTNEVLLEDGQGNVCVFRTVRAARLYRQRVIGTLPEEEERWGIFEMFTQDVETLLASRPSICISEEQACGA